MFGYVMANATALSEEDKKRYRAAYCGLCHTLGKLHSQFSRLTLNYDLTFLAIFHSALYREDILYKKGSCILHPLKKHYYFQTSSTEYAADMNIALSYYNLLDNWHDDKNYKSKAEARLLKKSLKRVETKYPRQCRAIQNSLRILAKTEKDNVLNPDLPATCFGGLMAEIFVCREDEYADKLRRFGFALGKFIYLLDAVLDLKKDIKAEKYNPLLLTPTENFYDILCLLMADCTAVFTEFTDLQNDNLLKNILYSGIWIKYENQKAKEIRKKEKHT